MAPFICSKFKYSAQKEIGLPFSRVRARPRASVRRVSRVSPYMMIQQTPALFACWFFPLHTGFMFQCISLPTCFSFN